MTNVQAYLNLAVERKQLLVTVKEYVEKRLVERKWRGEGNSKVVMIYKDYEEYIKFILSNTEAEVMVAEHFWIFDRLLRTSTLSEST